MMKRLAVLALLVLCSLSLLAGAGVLASTGAPERPAIQTLVCAPYNEDYLYFSLDNYRLDGSTSVTFDIAIVGGQCRVTSRRGPGFTVYAPTVGNDDD